MLRGGDLPARHLPQVVLGRIHQIAVRPRLAAEPQDAQVRHYVIDGPSVADLAVATSLHQVAPAQLRQVLDAGCRLSRISHVVLFFRRRSHARNVATPRSGPVRGRDEATSDGQCSGTLGDGPRLRSPFPDRPPQELNYQIWSDDHFFEVRSLALESHRLPAAPAPVRA